MAAMIFIFALSVRVAFVALVCLGGGGALAVLTWWFWTTSMPEPVALARLEIMSDRRFEKASPEDKELLFQEADIAVSNKSVQVARRKAPRPKQKAIAYAPEPASEPSRRPIDPLLQ